jgi:hypothetical protein
MVSKRDVLRYKKRLIGFIKEFDWYLKRVGLDSKEMECF